MALRKGSGLSNSGLTNCNINCSMLFLTSGCFIICLPRAAVMLRAPNLCSGGPCTRRMELMKPRIGRNVDFVLLVARERRKVVAAATGVVKVSYSSAKKK